MKGLYKLNVDCGRQGSLEGVFIADSEDVEYLISNSVSVYFGEVLGKHSEISGIIEKNDIELITTEQNVIDVVEKYGLQSGYNPFEYNVCEYETENIPENGVEWGDCTIKEYIDFMRKGYVPLFYKESYEKWKNNQKE